MAKGKRKSGKPSKSDYYKLGKRYVPKSWASSPVRRGGTRK